MSRKEVSKQARKKQSDTKGRERRKNREKKQQFRTKKES